MAKVVVEIAGGNLQNVYSDADIEVILIDWDNVAAGDRPPAEIFFADGTAVELFIRTEKSSL